MSIGVAIRLLLRALAFLVVTLFLASLLSMLLFIVVVFVFNSSGDNGGTLFDVFFEFGDGWPVFVACLLLAGVIVWRFLPIRRASRI